MKNKNQIPKPQNAGKLHGTRMAPRGGKKVAKSRVVDFTRSRQSSK